MSSNAAWLLACVSVASAAAAGFLFGPGAALGVVAALGALLFASTRGGAPRDEARRAQVPRSLAGPFLLSLAVHFAVAAFANLTGFAMKVAPDHRGYSNFGRLIARAWEDPTIDLTRAAGYSARSFYQHLNGAIWWLTGGDSAVVLSFLNGVAGTLAAWVMARVALDMYGSDASRKTFLLAALCPSLVLWSSTNLRDAWGWLLIALFLFAGQRVRERLAPAQLALLAASLAAMWFVRAYMVLLLLIAFGLSYLVIRFRRLPTTILGLALYALFVGTFGESIGLTRDLVSERSFRILQASRDGLAQGGAALGGADVSTPRAALAYLPIGIVHFLLSPLPWRVDTWRQAIAVPETLLWYGCLFLVVRSVLRQLRERAFQLALPLCTAAVITIAYGLVEGNEGTAYRHRAQIMPICFLFLAAEWARRSGRREEQG